MMTEVDKKRKISKGKIAGIVAGLVVAAFAVMLTGLGFSSGSIPHDLTVTGQVNTTGIATHPVSITFSDLNSGQTYQVLVLNGYGLDNYQFYQYTIPLPAKDEQLSTQIHWQGAFGSTGTCTAQGLTVPSSYVGIISQDLSC